MPTQKTASTDAIELLTADHKEVKALFKAYKQLVEADGDDEEKEQLALQICTKLTVHATVEEEIFYPAAREVLEDDEDLADEAEVEHASAKDLIAQIEESVPADALYDAKFKVLAGTSTITSRKKRARCSPRSGRAISISTRWARRWPSERKSCWPKWKRWSELRRGRMTSTADEAP